MNARLARVVSRLSLVSLVALSAAGAAACATSRTADTRPAPAAEAEAKSSHGPGYRMFRQIDSLDLTVDQRSALAEVEQRLAEDLAPHRETARQLATFFADGVENGKLDDAEVASHKEAISASIAEAKASFAGAMNAVHDVLDADQRAELVAKLHEEHARHGESNPADHPDARQGGPLAKVAIELGLTEDQKQAFRDAVRDGVEEIFPDRKAHREAMEARVKALGEAFVTDDFDAADHDLGAGADEALASFEEVTSRAVSITGKVLTRGQRKAVAGLIRDRIQKM